MGYSCCDGDCAGEDERVCEASMAKGGAVRNSKVEPKRVEIGQHGCYDSRKQQPMGHNTLPSAMPDGQRDCGVSDDGRHECLVSVRKFIWDGLSNPASVL